MKLLNTCCFEYLQQIPSQFFNLVIMDPPYGKTALEWDKPFDVNKIMSELLRVIKPNGTIIVFGQNPEISRYILQFEEQFKYDLTWRKSRKNGYVNASRKPLIETEKMAVFSQASISERNPVKMVYNPQFTRPCFKVRVNKKKAQTQASGCREGNIFISTKQGYPTDIIEVSSEGKDHPCVKPLQLYEELILTYSNLGDRVFDPCFGSGNSMLAAKNLNRRFIGVEREAKYYNKAIEKLAA